MENEWKHLSQSVNATIDELVALGLPETARPKAYDALWILASWQGDREYKNGLCKQAHGC